MIVNYVVQIEGQIKRRKTKMNKNKRIRKKRWQRVYKEYRVLILMNDCIVK